MVEEKDTPSAPPPTPIRRRRTGSIAQLLAVDAMRGRSRDDGEDCPRGTESPFQGQHRRPTPAPNPGTGLGLGTISVDANGDPCIHRQVR